MTHRMASLALAIFIAAGLTLTAYATALAPNTYFTDNMDSSGVSFEVTPLESALLNRINSATATIDAAFYDFDRASIRDALQSASARGVTVRVVTDDETHHDLQNDGLLFQALEAEGIVVKDDANDRKLMHDKYFIVDGRWVWTGSTNMSNNDFSKNHNNAILFNSTRVADVYQFDFEQMWDDHFGVAKSATPTTTLNYGGSELEIYFSPQDNALDQLVEEIKAAQNSIEFAIFFFTDPGISQALLERAEAGVQVRGLWDDLGARNGSSQDEVLCEAGIAVKIEDTIGKMHHKFMVIDAGGSDPRVVTGSTNWSRAADHANDENMVILHDGQTAAEYSAGFATMWDALDPATQCTPTRQLYLPLIMSSVAAADVQITSIVFNPPGDDLAGEHVVISNNGKLAQPLTGWQLQDEAGATYTFPTFVLASKAQVSLWVGAGTDTALDLFWGSRTPIWNNNGDRATLSDETGLAVDSCDYVGDGTEIICQ